MQGACGWFACHSGNRDFVGLAVVFRLSRRSIGYIFWQKSYLSLVDAGLYGDQTIHEF